MSVTDGHVYLLRHPSLWAWIAAAYLCHRLMLATRSIVVANMLVWADGRLVRRLMVIVERDGGMT